MSRPFTFGSLFAGIGGFDLGLERAGMVCEWQIEIDPFCLKVLEKHWPDVERFKDVKDCGKRNLAPVDLVCGGFPCQPHSVAGKRKGAEDDRNLWPEFLRIVEEIRPAWVLAENVPGIVRLYLDTVLADLESQDYSCWALNIPACAFNAPHRRERIFVVAHSDHSRQRQLFQSGRESWGSQASHIGSDGKVQSLAHTDKQGLAQWQSQRRNTQSQQTPIVRNGGESRNVAHAKGKQCNGSNYNRRSRPVSSSQPGNGIEEAQSFCSWWAIEPNVGRVADGIPNRVDRLRNLGNAVVPQVAEWIGKQIIEADTGRD